MRTVHTSYSASIAHELLRMGELLIIEPMDGATYRTTLAENSGDFCVSHGFKK